MSNKHCLKAVLGAILILVASFNLSVAADITTPIQSFNKSSGSPGVRTLTIKAPSSIFVQETALPRPMATNLCQDVKLKLAETESLLLSTKQKNTDSLKQSGKAVSELEVKIKAVESRLADCSKRSSLMAAENIKLVAENKRLSKDVEEAAAHNGKAKIDFETVYYKASKALVESQVKENDYRLKVSSLESLAKKDALEIARLKKLITEKDAALDKAISFIKRSPQAANGGLDYVFNDEKIDVERIGLVSMSSRTHSGTDLGIGMRVTLAQERLADEVFTGSIMQKTRKGDTIVYSLDPKKAVVAPVYSR